MKPVFIKSTTLGNMYFELLWNCYEYGREYKITDGSFAGSSRLEFDHVSGFITHPHIEPLAPIFPEGVPPVTTDEDGNEYFAQYIMNPELAPNEEYKYSQWINGYVVPYPKFCQMMKCEHYKSKPILLDTFCNKGIDVDKIIDSNIRTYKCPLNKQLTPIEWVIKHFQEKGYGNAHCYMNIGDPWSNFNYDIPYTNENDRRTSPCLRGLDFKIKDNQLIIHVIYRSWDLVAWPQNMIGFTLLNQYVASHLEGVEPGPMSFSSSGLHSYAHYIESIRAILNK